MAEEKKSTPKAAAEKKPAVKKADAPVKTSEPKAVAPKTKAAPKVQASVEGVKASVKKSAPKQSAYQARFKKQYQDTVRAALQKEFGYKSPMAVPTIVKIVVNIGVGEAVSDKNVVDHAVNDLTTIAGQKAVKTIARKSVSNFKLREGMPIGVKVTLRGNRMFDFFDKLVSVAIPRVRDFRGVKATGFDGRGNFTFGLREQLVFPEINYDKIDKVRGMDISIVTTAKTDAEARSLLNQFGFPFSHK